MKSWRTTLAAAGSLMAAVGLALAAIFDGDPATAVDWQPLIAAGAALAASLGLFVARDNKVSSEEAGAK